MSELITDNFENLDCGTLFTIHGELYIKLSYDCNGDEFRGKCLSKPYGDGQLYSDDFLDNPEVQVLPVLQEKELWKEINKKYFQTNVDSENETV